MTLKLTPDTLAAAYEYLRTTTPFRGWNLAPSDDVGFVVGGKPDRYAEFNVINDVPTIYISDRCVGHTTTLIAKMAHELCHYRQHLIGDRETHGPRFQRMAKTVCNAHGFDPKTF